MLYIHYNFIFISHQIRNLVNKNVSYISLMICYLLPVTNRQYLLLYWNISYCIFINNELIQDVYKSIIFIIVRQFQTCINKPLLFVLHSLTSHPENSIFAGIFCVRNFSTRSEIEPATFRLIVRYLIIKATEASIIMF